MATTKSRTTSATTTTTATRSYVNSASFEDPTSCAPIATTAPIAWAVPCLPAAQLASAAGGSYAATLAAMAAIFVAGGVTFVASTLCDNPVVDFHPALVLVPWAAFALGPLVTVVAEIVGLVAFLMVLVVAGERKSSGSFDTASGILVIVWKVCNVALAVAIAALRHKLRQTASRSTRSMTCCGDVVAGLFPCCGLVAMTVTVKHELGLPASHLGPVDVLPAYETSGAAAAV